MTAKTGWTNARMGMQVAAALILTACGSAGSEMQPSTTESATAVVSCDTARSCGVHESCTAVDGHHLCSAGACHASSDCADGYACHAGQCLRTEHTDVTHCPADSVLHDHFGGCAAGETATLVSHHPACVACVPVHGDGCTNEHDCEHGHVCTAGECVPAAGSCASDHDCDHGRECSSGACVPVAQPGCPEGSVSHDHFLGCHEGETASHLDEYPSCVVCTAAHATDPCAPGEPATVDSTSCHHPTVLAYRWNGHACEEVSGCSLVDPGETFATLSNCEHAHVHCPAH